MKLTEKLLKIQGAEFRVDKDWKNPHFKSSYVTLDNLLSVLLPLVTELKIAITHFIQEWNLVTQVVNTEMDNDMIISRFPIYQEDPQKIGSAITYAKRYNLWAIFNIITEVDDDGNSVSGDNHRKHDEHGLTLDDYIDNINMETDVETIKVYFTRWMALCTSDKQKQSFTEVKDKRKKQLGL